MLRLTLIVSLFLLQAAAPPAPAQEERTNDFESILQELYTSEFEPAADYDAWAARLISLAKDNLRSPALGLIYHKLIDIYDQCADPDAMDRLFEIMTKGDIPNGLVRLGALAGKRWMLIRKGRIDEATALDPFSSYARTVVVAGPFGFATGSLHHVVFPPERAIDLNADFDNKDTYSELSGNKGWRIVNRSYTSSQIAPFDHVYPQAGCCYALYQFKLPKAQPILFSISYEGSAKAWFNDTAVLDWNRQRIRLPSQDLIPLWAAAGWNRVLIKLSSGTAPFSLLITDRNGHPFPELEECNEMVLHPLGGDTRALEGVDNDFDLAAVSPTQFLRAHVEKHPESVPGRLALAAALKRRGLDSEALREGRTALKLDPQSAYAAFALGRFYAQAGYLPRNIRNNRSREMYAEAVRLMADHLPAIRALALIDHQNDRSEKAIESLHQVLEQNPDYYTAQTTLMQIFDSLNWTREYRDTITRAREIAPRRTAPLEELAEYHAGLGRIDLAGKDLLAALDLAPGRTDLLRKAADHAWDKGEQRKALDLYKKIVNITDSDTVRRKIAQMFRAMGDSQKVRTILEKQCSKYPGNPKHLLNLADLLLKSGARNEAIEHYAQVLKIAPDRHEVRDLLRELGADGYDDPVFEQHKVRGEDYMQDLPGKMEFPLASSILALDHMVTRIYADGSTLARIHQVIKILDKDAVEDYGRVHIPGRVETLRVITPDGRSLEPTDAEESGDFNMPGVDVGCLVEMCFSMHESNSIGRPKELGRFYFQDVDGKQPFLFSRSVVILPADMEIIEELKVPKMFQRLVTEEGGDRVYIFTAKDTPVAELENLMPHEDEAFPNVNFVQYRNWEQVAQILANIHDPKVMVTEEIREKASELIGDAEGDIAKAERLYAFVNDYVKSDDGSNNAIDVLMEGQGNRAMLFIALLEAARIGYDYIRCGLNPGYEAVPSDWGKVDLNLFPQELIRLHAGRTLVSMHSRMAPFGEIPHFLCGAPALKVTGIPERIETIPGGDTVLYREFEVFLDAKVQGENAEISGQLIFPGFNRLSIQEQLQRRDTNQRRRIFERGLLQSIYPGARVLDLEISGIDEVGAIPTFTFRLLAGKFVEAAGDGKACRLLPSPPDLTRGFIRKPERKYPMIRRGYSSRRFVMNVDLGEEYRLERLPTSMIERQFFLNYSLLTRETEKGFQLELDIEFVPGKVSPARYADLIRMLTAIDERCMEPVILDPVNA